MGAPRQCLGLLVQIRVRFFSNILVRFATAGITFRYLNRLFRTLSTRLTALWLFIQLFSLVPSLRSFSGLVCGWTGPASSNPSTDSITTVRHGGSLPATTEVFEQHISFREVLNPRFFVTISTGSNGETLSLRNDINDHMVDIDASRTTAFGRLIELWSG